MPTLRESLAHGSTRLREAGVERPTHEAAILLSAAEGLRKEALYARITDATTEGGLDRYERFLAERSSGTPIAYILGEKEFYGRIFRTDPRALIPRPDTEILVDRALELYKSIWARKTGKQPFRLHDCCTGTGCIPITLALELREIGVENLAVSGSDLSEEALQVARRNGERLAPGLVTFRQEDLLSGSERDFYDLITANPPYLTTEETTEALSRGWGEPRMALDGGVRGLDLLPRLVSESLASLRKNGYILIEAADSQASEIRALLREAGFSEIQTTRDLAGRERVTQGRR